MDMENRTLNQKIDRKIRVKSKTGGINGSKKSLKSKAL